jgi:hypothetical protein
MSRNRGRLQSTSISSVDVFEENERLKKTEAQQVIRMLMITRFCQESQLCVCVISL